MGNLHDLRIRQVQGILYPHRLFVLQVQDDLCLRIVDDAFPEPPAIQVEEVVQVLAGTDRRAAVAPDGLEYLQNEIPRKPCARCPGAGKQLPAFINEDSLLLGTVLLRPVPDEIMIGNPPLLPYLPIW